MASNPNQLELADQPFAVYTKTALIGTGVAFAILPTIFVALRFYARLISRTGYGVDDWILVPALIITIATGVGQIIAAQLGGMGSHQQLGPHGELIHYEGLYIYEKLRYFLEVVGTFDLGLIKISILLLYRRIFYASGNSSFQLVNNTTIGVVSAWTVAFTFALAFQCNPPSLMWELFEIEAASNPSCINILQLYPGVAISDLILDIWIVVLPIPQILRLQMRVQKKIAIIGMFLLSTIFIGSGIARVVTFMETIAFIKAEPLAFLTDSIWFSAGPIFWVYIEDSVAIIGACLPTLRPLFMKLKENTKSPESSTGKSFWRYEIEKGFAKRGSGPISHQKLSSGDEVNTEAGNSSSKECLHVLELQDMGSMRS